MHFRNRIAYSIEGNTFYVDNCFWIASVRNYNENFLIITRPEKDCISKFVTQRKVFKFSGADMFYNDYRVEPIKKNKYGSSI